MIKIKEMRLAQQTDNSYLADVTLYADVKDEVSSDMVIPGLPKNCVIEPGSVVYTANLDIGVYNGNGNWTWSTNQGGNE